MAKRQQNEGDVQNESEDSDSEMCNDLDDDNGDFEINDDGNNLALEMGNDVSDVGNNGISDDRRLQLESYLKAHKMVGEQGVERLLALQGTDPKNAALYQDMIWLLSTPGNDDEGETSSSPEEEEEMVVVKPEFDAETYTGGEYDEAEAEPYGKRRKLSDGLREMNTANPGRQTVTHLSQLPDDGKPWYDGCEYQCDFCPLSAKSVAQIANHLKHYHKKIGLGRGEGFAAEETTIECKICAVSMKRNVSSIKAHLNRHHKTTLEEYGDLYVHGSGAKAPKSEVLVSEDNESRRYPVPKNVPWYERCAFKCKGCDLIVFNRKGHGPSEHSKNCTLVQKESKGGKGYKSHSRDFDLVEQIIHDCRVCGQKVQQEAGSLWGHIKGHEMSLSEYGVMYQPYKENLLRTVEDATLTKQWFDGCEYSCALECPHTAKSKNAMGQHLKSIHQEKLNEGINFNIVQESFMQCQICSLDMLKSEGTIISHMTRFHSMTMEDYAEKHVNDGVVKSSAPEPVDKIKGIMAPKNIPWYDQSAYRCKSCKTIFWTVKDVNRHIKKCNRGRAEKETVRTTIHVCKICDCKVLCEGSSLKAHMKKHEMSLSDYGVKYQPYKENALVVENVTSSKQWFDGCEYKCALRCPHTSKSRNAMAQHLKATHKEKLNEDVNFIVIEESIMQCQICSLDMFQSEGAIRNHMTRFHSMTLEDYAEMHVKDGVVKSSAPEPLDEIKGILTPKNIPWYDKCAYRCKSCMTIFWAVKDINGHIKKCNKGLAEKETVRKTIHTCRICSKRVLQERSAVESHIRSKHGTSMSDYTVKFTPYADENPELAVDTTEDNTRWFDGCEYACLLCTFSNKTRNLIGKHMKGVHKIVNASEGEHYKTVAETSMDCALCSVSVMKSEPQIRAHLTKNHDMTMEEYAARFVHGTEGLLSSHFLDASPSSATASSSAHVEQATGEEDAADVEVPKNVMWYNRCRFRCKTCRWSAWDESAMNSHLRKCPWLAQTGQKRAESEMVVRKIYRCKVCNFAVTHKRAAIDGHLKKRHSTNLVDYSAQYEYGE